MISRSKLIDQVKGVYCLNGEAVSAASTSAHVSAAIDRLGYASMQVSIQQISATGANTAAYTTIHIYEEATNTGTYTIVNSASDTTTVYTTSSNATATNLDVDLSGYARHVKVYATPGGAMTNTVTLSISATLGDAIDEPVS
jgi:hypothetical protein